MILGTAGHIDHGKTALVRALTGVDTDRLAEEKRRGITIELGFAPLVLDDGSVVSMVDVPGHERFVDTMTAGAWPLDAALLVVAATEGVMPQTREHCAILRAFHVPVIAIALTNVDRVASADLPRIQAAVRQALEEYDIGSSTQLVHTVAPRGDGLDVLRDVIARASAGVGTRDATDLARFVIDRAFTLHGIGTVATGTLVSGSVRVGERARLLPAGCESRVRSIHTHGESIEVARAGARYAVALADVVPADVRRGSALVTDDAWRATRRMTIRVDAALDSLPRAVMLHVAGTSSPARSTVLDGARALTRLSLERPVVARGGDAVVLRTGGRAPALVAGVVVDPLPDRRAAVIPLAASATDHLEGIAAAAGSRGVARSELPVRLGTSPSGTGEAMRGGAVIELGGRVFARDVVAGMDAELLAAVVAWSREHPFARGVSIRELGTITHMDPALLEHLVARGAEAGQFASDRGIVALSSADLPARSAALLARVLDAISAAGLEPPTLAELGEMLGADVEPVVRHAERGGNLVRVGAVRWYATPVLAGGIERLRIAMRDGREYSPSALREFLGVSRKFLIPLLEYCDSIGVTERRSGGRVLVDVSSR